MALAFTAQTKNTNGKVRHTVRFVAKGKRPLARIRKYMLDLGYNIEYSLFPEIDVVDPTEGSDKAFTLFPIEETEDQVREDSRRKTGHTITVCWRQDAGPHLIKEKEIILTPNKFKQVLNALTS